MKYKLIERANPQDRNQSKWYAAPVNDGRVTQRNISAEIVDLSSLARGDVSNTIESMIDIIPKYLLMGKSVNLGDLGTLRLSFSSKGVSKPEDFHISMISGAKIIFTPSVELREKISKAKFVKS
jgi:predicted histone-like DNA-binding protein